VDWSWRSGWDWRISRMKRYRNGDEDGRGLGKELVKTGLGGTEVDVKRVGTRLGRELGNSPAGNRTRKRREDGSEAGKSSKNGRVNGLYEGEDEDGYLL